MNKPVVSAARLRENALRGMNVPAWTSRQRRAWDKTDERMRSARKVIYLRQGEHGQMLKVEVRT